MTPRSPDPRPDGHPDALPPPVLAALRRAVVDHGALEYRRVFAPVLHVGWPGRRVAEVSVGAADGSLDHGLACELVAVLRDRVLAEAPPVGDGLPDPLVWLTRRGALVAEDVDLRWLRAARAAYAESGATLHVAVVTRHGWLELQTGESRRWTRLRR